MTDIGNLEIHVAHSCNLACESCSHYSDQGHKGMLALTEAERWMEPWARRLRPRTFSLLGGEPTLHPELPGFVAVARAQWPAAHLRLVTNGFFLHRHPTLPAALRRAGNACIHVSIHHGTPDYLQKLEPVRELLRGWVRDHGIRVELYESFRNWTRRYHGSGSAMEPFDDGLPRQSWERCPARHCPQLFEGKIWKCGPLAYLKLQAAKYRLSGAWTPYLQYQPLAADCSDAQLAEFFGREDEPSCGMCPANPARFTLPVPLRSALLRHPAEAPA
jgi:hypothetical protein